MKKILSQHWFALFYAIILIIAIFTRFFKLGEVPVSIYWDEVSILTEAKVVSTTGLDQHQLPWFHFIYPAYGDYKLAPYIWLATLSVKLFGVSAWSVRLPAALAGVLTIIIGGLLVREISRHSKWTTAKAQIWQLSTMLVLTLSPWALLFSRTAFEGYVAQLFLSLSAYFFLLAIRPKKYWFMIFSLIFGFLATLTYYSVRFVLPVVYIALYLGLIMDFKFFKFKSKSRGKFLRQISLYLLLPLFLFSLSLLPLNRVSFSQETNRIRLGTASVLNDPDRADQVNYYRLLSGNNFFSRLIYTQKAFLVSDLIQNISTHLSPNYMFLTGDSNLRHGTTHHGLFLISFLPFFIIGLYQLGKQKFSVLLLLLAWWGVSLLPASVPVVNPHALRSLNALVPLAIIIGFGLSFSINFILSLKAKRPYLSCFSLVTLFLVIIIDFVSFYFFYLTVYPIESSSAWQDGARQTAEIITQYQSQVDVVNIVNFENLLYQWYYVQPQVSVAQIQSQPKFGFQPSKLKVGKVNFDFRPSHLEESLSLYPQQLLIGRASVLGEIFDFNPNLSKVKVYDYQTPDGLNHYQGYLISGQTVE